MSNITGLIIIAFAVIACQSNSRSAEDAPQSHIQPEEKNININTAGADVLHRFPTPDSFTRTEIPSGSFQNYLRTLKLKPHGSKVLYYDGRTKLRNDVYCAVVDLDIGSSDLHQCADAIMRLRGEYLWRNQQYDEISFDFTNGFNVEYSEWMKGRRMIVDGNRTYWDDRNTPSNSYEDFWEYMELIFMYAGTASLEKELNSISISEANIGDVLIQGGFPGHAVIIIDKATKAMGEPIFLLAQSYMPAQEIQILRNSSNAELNPWYKLDDAKIVTPEWTFDSTDLRRF